MEFRRRVASLLRSSARVRFLNLQTTCAIRPTPINARVNLFAARRAYATPGRPRSTVGETSRPAKKRTATKAKTTKKKQAKKTKKAAPKKVRKPLSERQVQLRAAKKEREQIKEYKTAALLDAPHNTRGGAYITFHSEKAKGRPVSADTTREIASEYKSLSPLEKQHYVTLAAENKEKALAALATFLNQHTPEQIRQANVARAALRKKYPKQKARYPTLQDERSVKQPRSSYVYFVMDQYATSGPGDSIASKAAELKRQWASLDASEKQRYSDLASQDRTRYQREYTNVYGHSPKSSSASSSPTASP